MEDMACGSSVYLTREAFPLKIYGSRIMPPGTYDALRIDLGKAEGKNWWCMLYPSLCYVDGVVENCGENDNMEETDADFSKEPAEFHIKWKIPEIIRGFFGKSNLEK